MLLEPIVESTRRRLESLVPHRDALLGAALGSRTPVSLVGALTSKRFGVIAELKRRSPSAGEIIAECNPADYAARCVRGGAVAISVLTEPDFFGGSLDDLREVRQAVDVPILRKDFVLHEAQVYEARIAGADAVLLIAAILSDNDLGRLVAAARKVGLEALVEVHSATELDRVNALGAQLVGVNNRNLQTFVTDLATAEELSDKVRSAVRIAESGVSDPVGAARMGRVGYNGILVGEALVRADDPTRLVGELTDAGREARLTCG